MCNVVQLLLDPVNKHQYPLMSQKKKTEQQSIHSYLEEKYGLQSRFGVNTYYLLSS